MAAAPETFGKFRLLSRIGEGGMGVVYRAETNGPDGPTTVVVKRVRPELVREPSFLRMMAQEARLGVLLRHPCLVPVLETGEIDGEAYLVLPFVDGYDLAQILDRAIRIGKQVPIGVACWLALQAAEALDYAHALRDERGQPLVIAHRDISPPNLMVTRDGNVKLLDFGIAKAADHTSDHTRTGTMKGKLAYFSPEQAEGLVLDARSDLFSLGIVLMEMLLQRRLFRGNGDFDTLRRVREAEIPRPKLLRIEIDDELDAVLLRLLERDRQARFASASALVEALRPIVQRHGGGANATREYLDAIGPITRRSGATSSAPTQNPQPPDLDETRPETPIIPARMPAAPIRSRMRSFFRRDDVTKAPLAEHPSHIARLPSEPRPPGVPRWKAYLDSLPAGLRSFPECTIKAAVVRNFSDYIGNPPLPPDVPRELLELAAHPPLVSSYLSGVVGRAIILALADTLGVDDDKLIERVYEGNVKLLGGPLYKMLFAVLSIERLVKSVESRWGTFHRGIGLEVVESGRGHAHAVIRTPPGFEPVLGLRMHATGIRVALEAVGARNVRTELDVVAPGEAHLHAIWDP